MLGERLEMTKKERQRKVMLDLYKRKMITLKEAAKELNLSYRQMKRVWSTYKQKGDAGIVHQSRLFKHANRAYPEAFKANVLSIYRARYLDFGPTFASEKLAELDQITLPPETLRRWLKAAGLWTQKRKRSPYRKRREARAQFGELLQLDGSFHDWFADGKLDCLMHMVDDATGTSQALLCKDEGTVAAFKILLLWIKQYGIPQAIYVDLKSTYISPKRRTEEEEENLTQFGMLCDRLGIEVIKAYSPQAKGRVERKHAVYQDRLCKEIKLNTFTTHEQVNAYLADTFIPKINTKWAKAPRDLNDAHVDEGKNIAQYFYRLEYRKLSNDWTISYRNTVFQVEATKELKPKKTIEVRTFLDQVVSLYFSGSRVTHTVIKKPDKKGYEESTYSSKARSLNASKTVKKTPWSNFNPGFIGKKETVSNLHSGD